MDDDSKLHKHIRKKHLYHMGSVEDETVYFGEHLFKDGYEEDMEKQKVPVRKGLDLLKDPKRWDDERHKVRALDERGKRIFIIYETSEEGNMYYFMEVVKSKKFSGRLNTVIVLEEAQNYVSRVRELRSDLGELMVYWFMRMCRKLGISFYLISQTMSTFSPATLGTANLVVVGRLLNGG